MKFHLTQAADRNLFTGYGDGYVTINNQRFEHSIVVLPAQPVRAWEGAAFDTLTADDFERLLSARPEIVILGTGNTLRFPRPELTRPLLAAAVGFEAMDTRAACRTYNILMTEGRQVLAAILL